MKSTIHFVYPDRVIEVSECSLGHYEDALATWRFSKTVWGKLLCLILGSRWRQVEYTHGPDHACIDLQQVVVIQIKRVY